MTTKNYPDLINKLLAKANGTDNELEASTYLAKASALQLEHMISDSDLRAAQGEAAPVDELNAYAVKNLPKGGGYIKARRDIVFGLASIFHCRVTIAPDRSVVRLYGHQSDIDFIQALYDSLSIQMLRHMETDAPRGVDRSWRTSFAHGWVARVVTRLRAARSTQETEASSATPGTAIVLRSRDVAVQDFFSRQMGGAKLRASYKNRSVRSAAGLYAGDAAGMRADLGGRALGTTRRELT